MRRIALLLLGLCLTVGTVGCKEDTTPDTDATPPADATKDTDADTDAADTDAADTDATK